LIELQRSLSSVRNWNVSVKEWDDQVVFLHRIVPGGADKSYGIHVARLAGIPRGVNERAKEILSQLNRYGQSKIAPPAKKSGAIQLTLFQWQENEIVDEIKSLDLTSMTPLQALQLLESMQRRAASIQ
jgi:DNA mismatch repair protein MutS